MKSQFPRMNPEHAIKRDTLRDRLAMQNLALVTSTSHGALKLTMPPVKSNG